jgi:hypothetical protein
MEPCSGAAILLIILLGLCESDFNMGLPGT